MPDTTAASPPTSRARFAWQALAAFSIVCTLSFTLQMFGGYPLTVTVPVGPSSRIEQVDQKVGFYRWRLPIDYRGILSERRA